MVLLRILPGETGSGNFKMAAAEPQVPIIQVLDKIATATKLQRVTHIFVVQQRNGTITDTARCNRKSVIQDGVRQTGSKPEVLISWVLDTIATKFQMLQSVSETRMSVVLLQVQHDVARRWKSKMAAD